MRPSSIVLALTFAVAPAAALADAPAPDRLVPDDSLPRFQPRWRSYLEVGGGVSPLLGLDVGVEHPEVGGLELGMGTGHLGDLFSMLLSFRDTVNDGYFALRYRTPSWHGLSLTVGPTLYYRTYEVKAETDMDTEETVAFGRHYQLGPEVGLSWRSNDDEKVYVGIDVVGRFHGTSSFVRKERYPDARDADWDAAKQKIAKWADKQSLSREWTRTALCKVGVRF